MASCNGTPDVTVWQFGKQGILLMTICKCFTNVREVTHNVSTSLKEWVLQLISQAAHASQPVAHFPVSQLVSVWANGALALIECHSHHHCKVQQTYWLQWSAINSRRYATIPAVTTGAKRRSTNSDKCRRNNQCLLSTGTTSPRITGKYFNKAQHWTAFIDG